VEGSRPAGAGGAGLGANGAAREPGRRQESAAGARHGDTETEQVGASSGSPPSTTACHPEGAWLKPRTGPEDAPARPPRRCGPASKRGKPQRHAAQTRAAKGKDASDRGAETAEVQPARAKKPAASARPAVWAATGAARHEPGGATVNNSPLGGRRKPACQPTGAEERDEDAETAAADASSAAPTKRGPGAAKPGREVPNCAGQRAQIGR